jgi:hypothetical protein
MPEAASDLTHVIDHILAKQHRGATAVENLALACGRCNRHKGPNVAGVDPETKRLTPLFNPRQDKWNEHFRLADGMIVGLTPVGRVTVVVLAMNHPAAVAARESLALEGVLDSN